MENTNTTQTTVSQQPIIRLLPPPPTTLAEETCEPEAMSSTHTVISNLSTALAISAAAVQTAPEPAYNCADCRDAHYIIVPGRGAKPCKCRQRRIIERAMQQIPATVRVGRLEDLQPRYNLVPDKQQAARLGDLQKQAISTVKQNPLGSYLLMGDNGAGKTHIAYTLYAHAAQQGRRVVACPLRDLLEDFKRYELGDSGDNGQRFYPRVSPSELQSGGEKWTILLDEFEKARVTEFTSEMLFNLLDAAWKYQHQLIVTSNMDDDELIARWSKIDDVYGRSIAKRLGASCTAIGLFF
jgi:DNA replication protein DnaC